MNSIDILTRSVELVYISHGIHEADLENTKADASMIMQSTRSGGTIDDVTEIIERSLTELECTNFDGTRDDAEYLFALATR